MLLSPVLTANATVATYQWLDCNTGFSVISGETGQGFTATSNGDYAVIVTQTGCADTSSCENVNNVSILENNFGSAISVFPNPTNSNLQINLGSLYNNVSVIVRNTLGQELIHKQFASANKVDLTIESECGVYFVEIINSSGNKAILKVIKN